jgi:UDP-N-acetylmuramate--alanine ligase
VEPIFVEIIEELPAAIFNVTQNGDVVLVMGAGSVSNVAQNLINFSHES